MAHEIERKFLVAHDGWKQAVTRKSVLRQAYLAATGAATVRVRIKGDTEAFLTVKSAEAGQTRLEFEYPIPVADAEQLLKLRTGFVIEKCRHIVEFGGFEWEIDVFTGDLDGLVVAELELEREGQDFAVPDWLGEEITDDARYYNAALASHGLPRSP